MTTGTTTTTTIMSATDKTGKEATFTTTSVKGDLSSSTVSASQAEETEGKCDVASRAAWEVMGIAGIRNVGNSSTYVHNMYI